MAKVPISSQTMVIISVGAILIGLLLNILGLALLGIINLIMNLPGLSKQFSAKQDATNIQNNLKIAAQEMDKGNYQFALSQLNNLYTNPLLTQEGKAFVQSLQARCHFHQKDFNEAYSLIKKVFHFKLPQDIPVEDYILKFFCEIQLNNSEEAKTTINEALQLFPNHPKLLGILQDISKPTQEN